MCLTIKEMGVLASLKDLVLRVEQYLKYQLYHAQNTYPYPEDQNVAEWVREEGEPNGWVRFGQDMPDDDTTHIAADSGNAAPVADAASTAVNKATNKKIMARNI